MSPLKTFAPEAFEIEMLWGAPSWLSKTMSKAVSALTETAVGTNLMSLAVIVTASPLGLPAGAAGVGASADALEQAASTAASASRPKVRVRRFMSVGLLVPLLWGTRRRPGRCRGDRPGWRRRRSR